VWEFAYRHYLDWARRKSFRSNGVLSDLHRLVHGDRYAGLGKIGARKSNVSDLYRSADLLQLQAPWMTYSSTYSVINVAADRVADGTASVWWRLPYFSNTSGASAGCSSTGEKSNEVQCIFPRQKRWIRISQRNTRGGYPYQGTWRISSIAEAPMTCASCGLVAIFRAGAVHR